MSNFISGTGRAVPTIVKKNSDFATSNFLDEEANPFPNEISEIIQKFSSITGIEERRYAPDNINSSDLAAEAGAKAISDAGVDKESIDYIIVAHNFGDTPANAKQSEPLPSVASKVKTILGIVNPNCVAYDLLFGCPGWVEGMIQANAFIKAGIAKRCLVIGAETLSRVVDPVDRDSMIFADGAGASIIEASNDQAGILSHKSVTYTSNNEIDMLYYDCSYDPSDKNKYIKMKGRKVYEFALSHVPQAMKACLDESGIEIGDLKKVFIHQANMKMDEAIIKRFYRLYRTVVPEGVLPMNIQTHGNSSVATIPTLYDQVLKNELESHQLNKGDIILFASVGAGMNINAITYKV
ncbi:MAG: ketoacyl-ACP synthase III [Candidatus Arcticimaribacter sp.]